MSVSTELARTSLFERIGFIGQIKAEPQRWLVPGILPEGGFTLLAGQPGAFKSWIALDIARAVSTGMCFAGKLCGDGREVMFVDRENGVGTVTQRRDLMRIPEDAPLRYWGRWHPLQFVGTGAEELRRYAEERKPLIVFDALCRLHTANENDNSEMTTVMADFMALSRAGATVLLVHHAGKNQGQGARGAMEIEAAPDVVFRVERKAQNVVRLNCRKNRFAEEQDIELQFVNGHFTRPWEGGER